jgi:hypothetical protein
MSAMKRRYSASDVAQAQFNKAIGYLDLDEDLVEYLFSITRKTAKANLLLFQCEADRQCKRSLCRNFPPCRLGDCFEIASARKDR